MQRRADPARAGAAGFSLVEGMIAVSVLAVGLLSLAGLLGTGVRLMADAPGDVVAKQKATEAVESVYTARDTRGLTWAQIRNVLGGSGSDGGVFLDGPQALRLPGPDGLTNTDDDGDPEALVAPGPDSQLGTDDDVRVPLSHFTREIRIRDVSTTLRELVVTVTYQSGSGRHRYVLRTFISAFA